MTAPSHSYKFTDPPNLNATKFPAIQYSGIYSYSMIIIYINFYPSAWANLNKNWVYVVVIPRALVIAQ